MESGRRERGRRRRSSNLLLLLLSLYSLLLHRTDAAIPLSSTSSSSVLDKPKPAASSTTEPTTTEAEAPPPPSLPPPIITPPQPPQATRRHLVEIYENEGWTLSYGWQRPQKDDETFRAWTYADGGRSLPPDEAQLPGGFEWASSEWRISRNNSTDQAGWRYANRFVNFDEHQQGHGKQALSDRARRRRWVRVLRPVRSKPSADEGLIACPSIGAENCESWCPSAVVSGSRATW